jgi:dipeptidyl aminopeptidase/acylaminoacyl peptidase
MLQAQPADRFALTIDNIMRGPGLAGYEPERPRWSPDSERVYFEWKQATDKQDAPMDTYVVNRDGSGLRKLTPEEARNAPPADGDVSRDKLLTVSGRNGDIFLYDNASGAVRRVTKTTESETNPRFLRDGKRIAFTRDGNLYVMPLETGLLEQLTDIRPAAQPDAAPTPAGGRGQSGRGRGPQAAATTGAGAARGSESQEYIKKEQKELLEAVRERAARREEDEARRKSEEPARKPFTLQARQNVREMRLTPDEKYVIAAISEAGGAKNAVVPSYVTESGYTEDLPSRSFVGDAQSRPRLAIVSVETGEVKWVDHGQKRAPSAPPAGENAAQPARTPQEQDREIQLGMPVWSEDGTKAVLMGRAADNKDRWIFALDAATGKTRALATDHDDAWVDGPGATTLGWMKNGREVYFQSERTGYSHLHAVAFEGGEPRALTSGKWEVLNARQSKDKSKFYLTASAEGPFENHLYAMDAEGGPLTRVTEAPGKHEAVVSPDDRWIADIYSYTNKPPELFIQENRPKAAAKKVTTSPAPDFSRYAWLDAPIVMVPARDGAKVPARLFKPAGFKKGGPAVIFIHGSGYLQNVTRSWSSYFREYMFDHILMERGFLVIDVDYRGSAGYGRDWRAAIYRHMGGKDLDDIVDAAKYIAAEHGVDPRKIGMFGGSYGGFLTLMGMFTKPDVFAAGAALRPVTDWAYYNQGYTADILNLPQSDAEAYRESSPIYFAGGLKGALLICHGMVDTNVHFQDTVRLAQKLIELRKENWEVAMFPVENHGFVEPSSWADEYKRILKLFERNLK